MKRPPGLWVLLSAGVLWLTMQDVYGIRATALVLGKITTTTTTTTTTTEATSSADEEEDSTELTDGNSTKPTLTGNPQLDYVWDPNLPKELNGYNLSDYPFYERVPEDIDFKCDGLHDGFYASVKHKCQVYHHCLYGTRYDFLCANYTAFDQKTFICHFASEVDCANSPKYWHRNDALYQAPSTTTVKPAVIYTTVPTAAAPPLEVPLTAPVVALPPAPSGPRRSAGPQRRPYRRRRPQLYYEDDYYDDDYYDDLPRHNRGRKRPRPRPRPIYDDDYDDYDDGVYERQAVIRRRPYDRRGNTRRRNKDKDFQYEDDSPEDYRLNIRGRTRDRKKTSEDLDDDYPEEKISNTRRPFDYSRPVKKRTRKPANRDYDEDYDYTERPNKKEAQKRPKDEPRAVIKPVSGTIYDRPRLAPKIKLPVPKNESEKYAYKPINKTPAKESEEYEEYVDDSSQSKSRDSDENKKATEKSIEVERTKQEKQNTEEEEYYDDYEDEATSKETMTIEQPSSTTSKTITTTQAPIENVEQPLIRLVKRPFLPSRGGNPYSGRSLTPVGAKAATDDVMVNEESRDSKQETQQPVSESSQFKPSSMLLKSPATVFTSEGGVQEEFHPQMDPRLMISQPEKVQERNPLDTNEFDVTLNDALNPTIANLPNKGYKDYTYANYRPFYGPEQAASSPVADYSSLSNVQNNGARQGEQSLPRNNNFNGQYRVYENQRHQQSQAFYSRY